MKAPNGYGNISKLSGKRRRPYWVRLTTGWEINKETGKAKQLYETLGYYATRKEAMLALAEYHNNPIDLKKKDITFSEVWDLWAPAYFKRTPSSENGLRAAYKRCSPLHNMSMKEIKKAHLQAIVDGMGGMSEQSQKKVKTVFKMTFKYCLENDLVTKDYSQFVTITTAKPSNVKDKFFTSEELTKLLSEGEETSIILLYTGMRIGELLNVKCGDVKGGLIHVKGTKTENADRIVPIHKDIREIIEKRLNGEFLIQDEKGKPYTYNGYTRKVFNPIMERLGLKHTPHALRHTFISLMDSAGVNKVALKRIVGHSNTDMSEHYTHKQTDELIEAMNKLKIK